MGSAREAYYDYEEQQKHARDCEKALDLGIPVALGRDIKGLIAAVESLSAKLSYDDYSALLSRLKPIMGYRI